MWVLRGAYCKTGGVAGEVATLGSSCRQIACVICRILVLVSSMIRGHRGRIQAKCQGIERPYIHLETPTCVRSWSFYKVQKPTKRRLVIATFIEHLPCARHCFMYFTCTNTLSLCSNPMKWLLLLSQFYRWGNWGSESLTNLPQA